MAPDHDSEEVACMDLGELLSSVLPAPPGLEKMSEEELDKISRSDAPMLASRSTTGESCLSRMLDFDDGAVAGVNHTLDSLEDMVGLLKLRSQQMLIPARRSMTFDGFAGPTATRRPMNFCVLCGARRPQKHRFCTQCGKPYECTE